MTTFNIQEFDQACELTLDAYGGKYPWDCFGIFPTEDSDGPPSAWWNSFVYTSRLPALAELWIPCCSIEDRCMGFDLAAAMLNRVASAYCMGMVQSGDDVIVPLGVSGAPDADDVNTIWWLGEPQEARYRQVNMSPNPICIPILWSSPLGWREVAGVCTDCDAGIKHEHERDWAPRCHHCGGTGSVDGEVCVPCQGTGYAGGREP